jgi:hypothetical protein
MIKILQTVNNKVDKIGHKQDRRVTITITRDEIERLLDHNCPSCFRAKGTGHEKWCWIGKALRILNASDLLEFASTHSITS